eukprot:gene55706-63809_t
MLGHVTVPAGSRDRDTLIALILDDVVADSASGPALNFHRDMANKVAKDLDMHLEGTGAYLHQDSMHSCNNIIRSYMRSLPMHSEAPVEQMMRASQVGWNFDRNDDR